MTGREGIEEARRILEETVRLAKALYGRRWIDVLEQLEDKYEGDPYWVLEHLREEARRRGIRV
ncbi:MAG: hypothetical protein F7B17_08795 [Desulfurococcales archaeon]|nr:hypothetical protein [Desulfurococcales archaeon]